MPLIQSRLKQLRQTLKLTQQDVADRIGVAQQQYADWERGRFSPSVDVVAKIANVLECSVDYVLGLSEAPNQVFAGANLTEDERKVVLRYRNEKRAKLLINAILELGDPPSASDELLDDSDEESGRPLLNPGFNSKIS
jgi:transcriptional regulator with XRE-family HTH domain